MVLFCLLKVFLRDNFYTLRYIRYHQRLSLFELCRCVRYLTPFVLILRPCSVVNASSVSHSVRPGTSINSVVNAALGISLRSSWYFDKLSSKRCARYLTPFVLSLSKDSDVSYKFNYSGEQLFLFRI